MKWEMYEVWSKDDTGYEHLIKTTKSLKEASQLAKANVSDEYKCVIVYQETDDGEQEEIERFVYTMTLN